jgi:hypothetical protein
MPSKKGSTSILVENSIALLGGLLMIISQLIPITCVNSAGSGFLAIGQGLPEDK